jgi:16S rRNA (guanine527-N7)-methyltransferase
MERMGDSGTPNLSADQGSKLDAFAGLLRGTAVPRGFVGERDADQLEERHVRDSLRAAAFLQDAARVYDLGSGAGLPGIPLAIVLPQTRFMLVEPLRKRAAFLELAIERLGLPNVEVTIRRAEELTETVDACVARALASLERSWELARTLLRPGGRLIYFAGASAEPPDRLPGASEIRIWTGEVLATAGRLVIITRT